jgi:hypothetical protein
MATLHEHEARRQKTEDRRQKSLRREALCMGWQKLAHIFIPPRPKGANVIAKN